MPRLVAVDVDQAPQLLVLVWRPHDLGSRSLPLPAPLFAKEQRVVLSILLDRGRTLLFVQLHTFFVQAVLMILNHSLAFVKFTCGTRLLQTEAWDFELICRMTGSQILGLPELRALRLFLVEIEASKALVTVDLPILIIDLSL